MEVCNTAQPEPPAATLSKAAKKKFNAAIIAGRFAQEECRFEGRRMCCMFANRIEKGERDIDSATHATLTLSSLSPLVWYVVVFAIIHVNAALVPHRLCNRRLVAVSILKKISFSSSPFGT